MESTPGSASAVAPTHTSPRVIYRYMVLFIGGMAFGIIAAAGSIAIPTNRIIVFNQPYSTYIKVTSVRIARPGFLVLYHNIDKEGGLGKAASYFLQPGYYRNLTIPINTDIIKYASIPIPFVARLYIDNGDRVFSEQEDTQARDVFGQLVNGYFRMKFGRSLPDDFTRGSHTDPFGYVFDVLFP